MSRLFELHDRRGSRHLSNSDLPLTIGTGNDAHLMLLSGQPVEAYLGSSESHLFLQPAPGGSPLFHNDTIVTTSVWIKSGDTTRIGNNVLHYEISGDRVEIRAIELIRQPTITPPDTPHPDNQDNGTAERPLPRVTEGARNHPARSRFLKLAATLLLLLLMAAGFTLAGHSLEISISPEPDSISIAGFPPVIKLGQNYFGLKGSYTLKAEKQGYQGLETDVIIGDGTDNRYSFTLQKMAGRITLFTGTVTGARVFIDDADSGETPLHQARIAAGEHQVLIQKDRYLDFKTTVSVTGLDQEQRFDFTLSPGWSDVTLSSEPSGATVLVNDEEKGLTPLTLELLTGTHAIVLQKEEFADHAMELTVPAGQTLSPEPIVLTLAPATVKLTSIPSGASMTADGVYQGTTPVTLQLSAKEEHILILSLQGFENLSKTLTLAPAESRSLDLTLKPEFGTVFLTTDPPDAELYIDGKHHGKATGRLTLQVGKHTLELRAKGYKTVSRDITSAKGYSRQVDIRLEPDTQTKVVAKKPASITTREGQNVLLMEPATFKMGASRRDPGRRANERLRTIQITRSYYIGVNEVTNKEFRRFKPSHSSGLVGGMSLNSDKQPVVNISWENAARYLNWLSSQDGLEPFYEEKNGILVPAEPMTTGYRLPFESEWSFAARSNGRNKASRYPWSGTFPPPPQTGNFADESARGILSVVIQGHNDSFPVSAPVASFPRDLGKLFDIGGNVSEWCHDLYSSYSGFSTRTEVDPTGPASGTHRVVRGSSWRDGSITELRLSYRSYSNQARDHIGFRIARFAQ